MTKACCRLPKPCGWGCWCPKRAGRLATKWRCPSDLLLAKPWRAQPSWAARSSPAGSTARLQPGQARWHGCGWWDWGAAFGGRPCRCLQLLEPLDPGVLGCLELGSQLLPARAARRRLHVGPPAEEGGRWGMGSALGPHERVECRRRSRQAGA